MRDDELSKKHKVYRYTGMAEIVLHENYEYGQGAQRVHEIKKMVDVSLRGKIDASMLSLSFQNDIIRYLNIDTFGIHQSDLTINEDSPRAESILTDKFYSKCRRI